ncbi:MAG: OmpP1/FadL family transporter [Gammaproteobacteria bacterium]
MKFTCRRILSVTFVSIFSCMMSSAFAAAFQQWNQDAAQMGVNQAGRAASADDASTEFYNPAGLVRIPQQQLVVGGVGLFPDYDFSGTSTYSSGVTSSRTGSAQGAEFYAYPFLHYAAPISDKFAFGFGVSSPFAIKTDWGDTSSVSYIASQTDISTIDITTDLAYAITQKISVGAGVDVVRVMISDYDYTTPLNTSGSSYYTTDLSGYDWTYGWHAGALYQYSEHTRFGLAYHSSIDFNASDSVKTVSSSGGDLVSSSNFEIDGELPSTTVLSAYHDFNDRFAGMTSVTFTRWSDLNDLKYKNLPTNTGIVSSRDADPCLEDTWGVNVGGHFKVNNKILLRAGIGYETSPADDDAVYLRAPDNGVLSASVGAHVQATETIGFDIGWTHLFYLDDDVSVSSSESQGTSTTVSGSLDANTDILGAQVVWNMT